MLTKRDYVRTIEAIYTIDRSEHDWLADVVESARTWLNGGQGLFGYSWSIANDEIQTISDVVTLDGPRSSTLDAAIGRGTRSLLGVPLPPEIARATARIMQMTDCNLSSNVIAPEHWPTIYDSLEAAGIVDTLGINGRETRSHGVFLGCHLVRRRRLARREANLFRRIARHMAAGSRLRRRLEGRGPTDAEAAAILTPAGRLEHATPAAAKADARAALREAVLAVDRARGAERRREPERAIERWRVLADARFSLIDRFESDGKRYVVACENHPAMSGEEVLTQRERQIVALYRLGAHSKLIAYELGLADATVRVLLSRATRRLGLTRPRALRAAGES